MSATRSATPKAAKKSRVVRRIEVKAARRANKEMLPMMPPTQKMMPKEARAIEATGGNEMAAETLAEGRTKVGSESDIEQMLTVGIT